MVRIHWYRLLGEIKNLSKVLGEANTCVSPTNMRQWLFGVGPVFATVAHATTILHLFNSGFDNIHQYIHSPLCSLY